MQSLACDKTSPLIVKGQFSNKFDYKFKNADFYSMQYSYWMLLKIPL